MKWWEKVGVAVMFAGVAIMGSVMQAAAMAENGTVGDCWWALLSRLIGNR